MTDKKFIFKASQFATIQKSGSVSVKLNEFLGSKEGRTQLDNMKLVRDVAERSSSVAVGNEKK
jgi:hypothetical protein